MTGSLRVRKGQVSREEFHGCRIQLTHKHGAYTSLEQTQEKPLHVETLVVFADNGQEETYSPQCYYARGHSFDGEALCKGPEDRLVRFGGTSPRGIWCKKTKARTLQDRSR